jgi:hypothetical protein
MTFRCTRQEGRAVGRASRPVAVHAPRDGQEALSRPTILISGHRGVECG